MITKSLLLVALCISSLASGRIVTWTGAGGNGLWGYGPNWDQGVIPTAQDDVLFNSKQNTTVTVAAPVSANSILLGANTPASIQLLLQSSLTVGQGGVNVESPSVIVLQTSTNLPFSSAGAVNFNGTNTFRFLTGAITGLGAFNVLGGASISILNAGEKLITGTVLYNFGTITINGSDAGPLIQLEKQGSIVSIGGSINVTSSATFLSQDGTGLLQSEGSFVLRGGLPKQLITLTLQTPANFETGITILQSAEISIQDSVLLKGVNGNLNESFVTVNGNGILELNGNSSLSFQIGILRLDAGAVFISNANLTTSSVFLTQAKVLNTGNINATAVWFDGGYVSGSGSITGRIVAFGLISSDPITLDSTLTITNSAYTINDGVNVLFDKNARLIALPGSVFRVAADTSFELVGGSPYVSINGSWVQDLSSFTTTVNLTGNGNYSIVNSNFTLQAASLLANVVNTSNSYFFAVASPSLKVQVFDGNGNLTIQANPSASLGRVQADSFTVTSGNVVTTNFTVRTFNLTNGAVQFVQPSYAKTFNFFGGALSTATTGVRLTTSNTTLFGAQAKTLSGVRVVAPDLEFECGAQCTVIFENGAVIGTQ